MVKKLPANKFKDAVKALNEVLKKANTPTIEFAGIKKMDVVEQFTRTILDYIDNDKVIDLPDEAIIFYNSYIVDKDDI
ncbi:MAG: hypothetical protein ACTSUT_04000 [Promethearchaeota archaeon]